MLMTGVFASAGRPVLAGVRLFMQQHGDMVGGKKIQLIVKDVEAFRMCRSGRPRNSSLPTKSASSAPDAVHRAHELHARTAVRHRRRLGLKNGSRKAVVVHSARR
jgi:hypothetical protein